MLKPRVNNQKNVIFTGKFTNHKGRNRRFTNPEELEEERRKEEEKRKWRQQRGESSSSEEEEEGGYKGSEEESSEEESSDEEVCIQRFILCSDAMIYVYDEFN